MALTYEQRVQKQLFRDEKRRGFKKRLAGAFFSAALQASAISGGLYGAVMLAEANATTTIADALRMVNANPDTLLQGNLKPPAGARVVHMERLSDNYIRLLLSSDDDDHASGIQPKYPSSYAMRGRNKIYLYKTLENAYETAKDSYQLSSTKPIEVMVTARELVVFTILHETGHLTQPSALFHRRLHTEKAMNAAIIKADIESDADAEAIRAMERDNPATKYRSYQLHVRAYENGYRNALSLQFALEGASPYHLGQAVVQNFELEKNLKEFYSTAMSKYIQTSLMLGKKTPNDFIRIIQYMSLKSFEQKHDSEAPYKNQWAKLMVSAFRIFHPGIEERIEYLEREFGEDARIKALGRSGNITPDYPGYKMYTPPGPAWGSHLPYPKYHLRMD